MQRISPLMSALALTAATLLAYRWWPVTPAVPPVAVSAPGEVRPPAVPHVAPAPVAPPPDAASVIKPRQSSVEMTRKLNSLASLRVFVYEAMSKPEGGGHAYAFFVLDFCTGVDSDGALAILKPPRRAAAAALAQRCDMSKEERRAARAQLLAGRRLNHEPDPYMPLGFELMMAGGEAAHLQAVANILDTQDPLTLWSLAYEGSASAGSTNDGDGIYFAGRYYAGEEGAALYNTALQLVLCSFGMDCGPGSLPALIGCVRDGWCTGGLSEAVKQDSGPAFAQIEALAAQLTLEIKRKNARAFVPRR